MKADQYGTCSEQSRWRCGWLPARAAAQLRKDGTIAPDESCGGCDHYQAHDLTTTLHCTRHHFASRDGAWCREYYSAPPLSPQASAALDRVGNLMLRKAQASG